MIATLLFTFIAAGLVFIAGRRDMARDPRLTMVLLLICGAFPFLATLLPKWTLLPAAPLPENTNGEAGLPWLTVVLAAWATGVLWQLGHIGQAMVKLHRWKATATALETVDSITTPDGASGMTRTSSEYARPHSSLLHPTDSHSRMWVSRSASDVHFATDMHLK